MTVARWIDWWYHLSDGSADKTGFPEGSQDPTYYEGVRWADWDRIIPFGPGYRVSRCR